MKDTKKTIKCPKCGTKYEEGKQFCQKCMFNMAYWIKNNKEYEVTKAQCLPFTKGL